MTEAPKKSPSASDMKRLFALSGNRCAFPKCGVSIITDGTVLGEVSHIHAASPKGPRYLASQSDAERHDFDNLILLCANHHTVVDDDEEAYTADRLRKMKRDHENQLPPPPEDVQQLAARLLLNQSVRSVGQSGGIAANSVRADTINLHTAVSSTPADARRLEAIEIIWNVIAKLKDDFNMIVFIDSILTDDELRGCFAGHDTNGFFEGVQPFVSQAHISRLMTEAGIEKAQRQRPFVSAALFEAYNTLQAVIGRSAVLIEFSFRFERFHSWRTDSGMRQILESVYNTATIEAFIANRPYGLRSVIESLSERFLEEARRSG